jgi:hypothetical protein
MHRHTHTHTHTVRLWLSDAVHAPQAAEEEEHVLAQDLAVRGNGRLVRIVQPCTCTCTEVQAYTQSERQITVASTHAPCQLLQMPVPIHSYTHTRTHIQTHTHTHTDTHTHTHTVWSYRQLLRLRRGHWSRQRARGPPRRRAPRAACALPPQSAPDWPRYAAHT